MAAMTLLKFDRPEEIKIAARYRRMLTLLAKGLTVNEAAELLGVAKETGWNYAEEALLRHEELRPKIAAYALSLVGGDSGFEV